MSGKYSCTCKHAHSLSIWISLTFIMQNPVALFLVCKVMQRKIIWFSKAPIFGHQKQEFKFFCLFFVCSLYMTKQNYVIMIMKVKWILTRTHLPTDKHDCILNLHVYLMWP